MGEPSVHGIILAAGKAERFGRDKLTVEYQGRALVSHVFGVVAAAVRQGLLAGGFVVLRAGAHSIEALARQEGLTPVVNPDADAGISASLRAGLAAIDSAGPRAGAAMVFPGDQPHVRLDVIGRLIETWRRGGSPAVRPRYSEEPGSPNHPVLLDATLWPLVSRLAGDSGFASIFREHPELVTTIDVAGRNPDMDTPLDLLQSSPAQ
ncbi:MAG TPA: nucleotidyltransferase family protein [Gemmatimonadales bacterium]|jgi:CTP:molybdopterin cytidylyltransferase MocA|nr:nucleotidyltransferase family protein [Gemmatimonadales bacterium]